MSADAADTTRAGSTADAAVFTVRHTRKLRIFFPERPNADTAKLLALATLFEREEITFLEGPPAIELIFEGEAGQQVGLRFEGGFDHTPAIPAKRLLKLAQDLLYKCAAHSAAQRKPRHSPASAPDAAARSCKTAVVTRTPGALAAADAGGPAAGSPSSP
jgi:hypothetical protein